MASNSQVQFWGNDAVLQAFDKRGLPGWSNCMGKQFLVAGEGRESLGEYLTMIQRAAGVYTLKVYDETDPEEIDDLTPAKGSFNFKPAENPGAYNSAGANGPAQAVTGAGGLAGMIQQRIEKKMAAKVDKWLDSIDDDEEADDEPKTIGAIVNDYISDPEKLIALLKGVGLFGGASSAPQMQQPQYNMPALQSQQPQFISGAVSSLPEEERYKRLGVAIETLEKADPDILLHLEKLAGISTKNPVMFSQLIGMLKTF